MCEEVIRSRNLKDGRQFNDQDKHTTNNGQYNTTRKT